ncbi:ATP-binding cassette domain-containing protein [Bacillus timonensis]|nr:ATP-binding cassette domain-containing protein [Bacillus timonensis]
MEVFKINNLAFSYSDQSEFALNDINFSCSEGEFIVISGESGCGKSTLLKQLKVEITPFGQSIGSILYYGEDINSFSSDRLSSEIGFVFQDPDNQVAMDEVYQELVFGMENANLDSKVMRKRIAEFVHFFDLEPLLYKKTFEISGGQKQLMNLASILLLQPKVILLDEPTSQLDPISAKEFLQLLRRLNQEFGITVILVEHRLDELIHLADRIIVMKEGKIIEDAAPTDLFLTAWRKNDSYIKSFTPSIPKLVLTYSNNIAEIREVPLSVKEGKKWVLSNAERIPQPSRDGDATVQTKVNIMECNSIYFQYAKKEKPVIKNLDVEIKQGELFTILGKNGSGKSTLLKVLSGILKNQQGKISFKNRLMQKYTQLELQEEIAYLPQNPKALFIHDTIQKELDFQADQLGVTGKNTSYFSINKIFDIEKLLHKHPYDCSGGELQRAALACLLISNPSILFIDEPTKGLDPLAKKRFGDFLKMLIENGKTIVMATHDMEFAAQYSSRCAIMFDGEISAIGTAMEFFKDNYFYTTVISRITRGVCDGLITVEEGLNN